MDQNVKETRNLQRTPVQIKTRGSRCPFVSLLIFHVRVSLHTPRNTRRNTHAHQKTARSASRRQLKGRDVEIKWLNKWNTSRQTAISGIIGQKSKLNRNYSPYMKNNSVAWLWLSKKITTTGSVVALALCVFPKNITYSSPRTVWNAE